MTTFNPNWALEASDKAAQAEELEDLVAEIKSIIESPYQTAPGMVVNIKRAILEAGY